MAGTSTCAIVCVIFGGCGYGYGDVVCLWDKVRFERREGLKDCGVRYLVPTFSMGADINCFRLQLKLRLIVL